MATKRKANPKRKGGARVGSGRKARPQTLALRALQAEKVEDAEYAYALHVETMRNPRASKRLRLGSAVEVMNRVWGKPTLHVKQESVVRRLFASPPAPPEEAEDEPDLPGADEPGGGTAV